MDTTNELRSLSGLVDQSPATTFNYFEAIEIISIGDFNINHEFSRISEEDLIKGETIGIVAALIILVAVFAALITAGLPLSLGLFSITIATGLAAIIGRMIGLAVGIDVVISSS